MVNVSNLSRLMAYCRQYLNALPEGMKEYPIEEDQEVGGILSGIAQMMVNKGYLGFVEYN